MTNRTTFIFYISPNCSHHMLFQTTQRENSLSLSHTHTHKKGETAMERAAFITRLLVEWGIRTHQCLVLTRAMWVIRSRIRLLDQSRPRKGRKLEASWRFNFQQTMRQVAARSLSPVGPLLVVPWHKLHEGRAQSDTSLGVKDTRPDFDIRKQRRFKPP